MRLCITMKRGEWNMGMGRGYKFLVLKLLLDNVLIHQNGTSYLKSVSSWSSLRHYYFDPVIMYSSGMIIMTEIHSL